MLCITGVADISQLYQNRRHICAAQYVQTGINPDAIILCPYPAHNFIQYILSQIIRYGVRAVYVDFGAVYGRIGIRVTWMLIK